jgi:Family of unknown function (DUF6677)
MTTSADTPNVALPQQAHSFQAALLSYLIPGLGQVYQGRIVKGLLFFVCLYGMFFFGLYLGDWQNVYIQPLGDANGRARPGRALDLLIDRARPLGQVWIGVAFWPAIWQYATYNPNNPEERHPVLGNFMRMPPEPVLNDILRNSDKTPDLGWMYTVIAGVLNILVIYDAYAGPALGAAAARHARQPQPGPAQEATVS